MQDVENKNKKDLARNKFDKLYKCYVVLMLVVEHLDDKKSVPCQNEQKINEYYLKLGHTYLENIVIINL